MRLLSIINKLRNQEKYSPFSFTTELQKLRDEQCNIQWNPQRKSNCWGRFFARYDIGHIYSTPKWRVTTKRRWPGIADDMTEQNNHLAITEHTTIWNVSHMKVNLEIKETVLFNSVIIWSNLWKIEVSTSDIFCAHIHQHVDIPILLRQRSN